MFNLIKSFTNNADEICVCIENYSYGSSTDGLIQMVEATAALKYKLLSSLVSMDKFFIVPGPTIKMWVGSGAYEKSEMFESFINDVKNDNLINDPFNQVLRSNPSIYWHTQKRKGRDKQMHDIKQVYSPVNDLIDAYFIALWLERTILEGPQIMVKKKKKK